jgi:hypothetical protein
MATDVTTYTHTRRYMYRCRYSSYSFSTLALDGGEWSASRPGRALAPEKGPHVPIVQEAGWAPEPVWTLRLEEKSFRLCRVSNLDRSFVQPTARHYTDSYYCVVAYWIFVFQFHSAALSQRHFNLFSRRMKAVAFLLLRQELNNCTGVMRSSPVLLFTSLCGTKTIDKHSNMLPWKQQRRKSSEITYQFLCLNFKCIVSNSPLFNY